MNRSSSSPEPSSALLGLLQRHPYAAALCCFFLSGAAGLVYEVVWCRRLALTFGATVLATSTVLAVFMGGLALGSLIFGRMADVRPDALRLYALLEGGVGLMCFCTPWLFLLVEHTYAQIQPALMGQVWLLRLARFSLCAAVLIVPTVMMGGTLPVLSRALVRRETDLGSGIAALYGVNTLGAVVGAAGAGFVLIPIMGLRGTVYMAAVLNLAIAAVAYALYWLQTGGAEAPAIGQEQSLPPGKLRTHRLLMVAYGLSGAAALIYEVGWTRTLSLAFGTSTYAFSAMLAAFLAGIGLGSLVLAASRLCPVDRLRNPLVWFGVVEVAIGASVVFLSPLLDRLPFVFLHLFRGIGPRFWALQFAQLGISAAVMLLPAALMGLAFPLVARLATESLGVLGRRLSAVYAANTLGTVVGSFAAGFVLIPALGVRNALGVGVALNLLVGVCYLLGGLRQRPWAAGTGLALAAAAVVGFAALPRWDQAVLSSGAYIYPSFYLQGNAKERMQDKEVLYYKDALTGTISVTRVASPLLDKPMLSLQVNGKTDASTSDLSTQLLLGHFAALLHPDPKSVLVIGLASGCTLGALELHPEIEHIDCVEIEPEMAKVTEFFRDINGDCLSDPRVNLALDDARSFVTGTRHSYDLITSEPSNPWISGVANLFTLEHFANCKARLNPGGVMCQWIPFYNMAPDDLRTILATFRQVFPDCSLWLFPDLSSDGYLIGWADKPRYDVTGMLARSRRPEIAAGLRDARVHDLWGVLCGYLLGADTIEPLSQGALLNTDDRPVLEFSSPMTLHTGIARVTLEGLLKLGECSKLALDTPDDPPSAPTPIPLTGLQLRAPWSTSGGTQFTVSRDSSAFLMGRGADGTTATLEVPCALGKAQARLYVQKEGAAGAGSSPHLPQGAPSAHGTVSGHEASIWERPEHPEGAAWVASWSCAERGQRYTLIVDEGPLRGPSPVAALANVACRH